MHYPAIAALRNAGYTVVERSPWHYQCGNIDIWPSKRKWMVKYDSGASFYKDAGDLLRIVMEKFEKKKTLQMPPVTKAEKVWREGLRKLQAHLSTC